MVFHFLATIPLPIDFPFWDELLPSQRSDSKSADSSLTREEKRGECMPVNPTTEDRKPQLAPGS